MQEHLDVALNLFYKGERLLIFFILQKVTHAL